VYSWGEDRAGQGGKLWLRRAVRRGRVTRGRCGDAGQVHSELVDFRLGGVQLLGEIERFFLRFVTLSLQTAQAFAQ
jgi:hypothetical protein